jgi:serine/threonine-protein kinase
MSQAQGRFIQNKYEIVSKIKQGGFGIVYYGYDHVFDKPVAIKAIEPSLLREAKYVDLFLEEAKNAGKLSHNNIVHIYNLVRDDDGQFFIIMEYINGLDLGKILRQCRRQGILIPQELSIFIIKEICKALEYAHNKRDLITEKPLKLVHLDISPSNIMVSFSGQVKLIDFGLAKIRFQNNRPNELVLSGKLPYMAPEQLNGGAIDRRTDLFSLGTLFYEMLTGSRLFPLTDPEQTVELIKRARMDTTLLEQHRVPETIQRILLKMTQRDPEQRYHGANGVYLDLVECLMTTAHSVELSEELSDFLRTLFNYHETPDMPTTSELSEEVVEPEEPGSPSASSAVDDRSEAAPPADDSDDLSLIRPDESIATDWSDTEMSAATDFEPTFDSQSAAIETELSADEAQATARQTENFVAPDTEVRTMADYYTPPDAIAEKETQSDAETAADVIADAQFQTEEVSAPEVPTLTAEESVTAESIEDQAAALTEELNLVNKTTPERSSPTPVSSAAAMPGTETRPPKPMMVKSPLADDEGEDDLKTVIDVIRLSTSRHKKILNTIGISLAGFLLLFLIIDISFQITSLGTGIYNRLFPPAIKITTAPSGAVVLLDNKPISGKTPLSIPRIAPGVHELTLTYPGYAPLVKSIQVPSKGDIKVSGEQVRKGYEPYLFRFKTKVAVSSDPPGAVVYINNNPYLHKTPTSFEWEVGVPLAIDLELDGFQKLSGFRLNTEEGIEEIEDRRLWSFEAIDRDGRQYVVDGKFRKFVTVNSIPPGVTFYIDGSPNPSGRTDVSSTIALNIGQHELLFKKDGFNPQRINLNVGKSGPEAISVILTRNVRFFATDKTDLGNNDIGATISKIIQSNKQYLRNDKTPCEISLPPINLQVVLTKKGYADAIVDVSPRDKDIVVKMEPATVEVEVVVNDALTGLPLKDAQVSYRSLSQEQAPEVYYGATDEKGFCTNKISPGEYSFRVKKFGYFEKFAIIDTKLGNNRLEFKLIIQ